MNENRDCYEKKKTITSSRYTVSQIAYLKIISPAFHIRIHLKFRTKQRKRLDPEPVSDQYSDFRQGSHPFETGPQSVLNYWCTTGIYCISFYSHLKMYQYRPEESAASLEASSQRLHTPIITLTTTTKKMVIQRFKH